MLGEAGYTSEADLKRVSDYVAKEHVSLEVRMVDPKLAGSCKRGRTKPRARHLPACEPVRMPRG